MSREVRRVPLDFDFPLGKTWSGYLMPDSLAPRLCPDCNGSGQTHFGWWLQNFSYVMSMMADDVRDQAHDKPMHPWLTQFPRAYGHWDGDGRYAIDRLSPDAVAFFAALASLQGRVPGGMSTDTEPYLVYHALLKLTGVSVECPQCHGEGSFEAYPGQDADRDAWERTAPPEGPGWQLWQTVSGGGPVSPVFENPERLAEWMALGGEASTYMNAIEFIRVGWAPSGVSDASGYRTGVDFIGGVLVTDDYDNACACARCRGIFQPGDRIVSDPCWGAPDCVGLADRSHFDCLPAALQRVEEDC